MKNAKRHIIYSTALLFICAGCSISDCGWTDIGNLGPREALVLAQSEEGPASFPPQDVVNGKGRVVQHGRKITILVEELNEDGKAVNSGEMTFLYPPLGLGYHNGFLCNVCSGKVPEYFFPCIAGMRAGGVRKIILPRTTILPDQEPRCFTDAVSGKRILELPQDQEMALRVTILKVCRPVIKTVTTYSIPAMRNRRVQELWCW